MINFSSSQIRKFTTGIVRLLKRAFSDETINVLGYKLGKRDGDVRYIEAKSVRRSSNNSTNAHNDGAINFSDKQIKKNMINYPHTNIESSADGVISNSAQYRRGNCYFLASINAIRNTKNGQAVLQKIVTKIMMHHILSHFRVP